MYFVEFHVTGVDVRGRRFKKKVLPGDTLRFKASVISSKRGIWKFKCSAHSEEELVCAAEILCADRSLNE